MSTITVTRRYAWAMAHRLQHHKGPCKFLHGHNYEAEVEIQAQLDHQGMVMDFGDMKSLQSYIDRNWDHATMLRYDDPLGKVLRDAGQTVVDVDSDPTAERIASMLASIAAAILVARGAEIVRVSVYETSKLAAHWRRQP